MCDHDWVQKKIIHKGGKTFILYKCSKCGDTKEVETR